MRTVAAILATLLAACGGAPAGKDGTDTAPTTPSTIDTGNTDPRPEIALPVELDFGEVGVGCVKTMQLRIGSEGDYPLEVTEVELIDDTTGTFDITPATGTIAVGEFLNIPVRFAPDGQGTFEGGRVRIRSTDRDDALASVPVRGGSAADPVMLDTFDQAVPPPVDLLLVFQRNDGESVVDGVKAVLPDALSALASAGLDFQVAVLNMAAASGPFLGATPIVTSAMVDPGQIVVDNLGTSTNNETAAFTAVAAALSPPYSDNENAGFVRPGAQLAVVTWAVTDDDSTTHDDADIAALIEAIHADPADSALHTVSGNAGILGIPCLYGGLFAGVTVDAAPRLADAAQLTGGVHVNICQNSAGEAVQALVEQISGIRGTFELSGAVTDPTSIAVEVDGVAVPQDSSIGFVFQSNPDRISFASSAIPDAGSVIEVSYATTPECGP